MEDGEEAGVEAGEDACIICCGVVHCFPVRRSTCGGGGVQKDGMCEFVGFGWDGLGGAGVGGGWELKK